MQDANQKPISSAPGYRAQYTLPSQSNYQTFLFQFFEVCFPDYFTVGERGEGGEGEEGRRREEEEKKREKVEKGDVTWLTANDKGLALFPGSPCSPFGESRGMKLIKDYIVRLLSQPGF